MKRSGREGGREDSALHYLAYLSLAVSVCLSMVCVQTLRKRLETFHSQTVPLVSYYQRYVQQTGRAGWTNSSGTAGSLLLPVVCRLAAGRASCTPSTQQIIPTSSHR